MRKISLIPLTGPDISIHKLLEHPDKVRQGVQRTLGVVDIQDAVIGH